MAKQIVSTEKWMVSMKRADFKSIAARFHIDQVTARLIRNRGLTDMDKIDKYLNASLDDMYSPRLMKDMEKACDILQKKISERKPIRVIGDYDADGVMSTYILLTGLKRLGALADEQIPDRVRDGYGLNESLVLKACEDHIDTIITCDNGISAADQVAAAKKLGMTVIITDHHEVPFDEILSRQIIPEADACIDPKQNDCAYPFKGLCGASVAWKLVSLLYEKYGISNKEATEFITFAAIATVCDVCELIDENRIIVKYGLLKMRRADNPGLRALIRLNNLEMADISVYHIGFVLGPCVNASGRLDTAEKALRLFFTKNSGEALALAKELININASRKEMTEEYAKEAYKKVDESQLSNDMVLVVYLPDCHESLAGIIAGRLRERYNKPAFVITDSENRVKGSGRSIEEYQMYAELSRCRDILIQFGGHPMAAGFSLKKEDISSFRKILNANCALSDEDIKKKVHIDMILPLKYISEKLINDFEKLKPFGIGNPRPLFAGKNLRVIGPSVIGKNNNAAKMRLADESGRALNAIYFGDAEEFVSYVFQKKKISAVFYPSLNTYRGVSSIQLVITNYQ